MSREFQNKISFLTSGCIGLLESSGVTEVDGSVRESGLGMFLDGLAVSMTAMGDSCNVGLSIECRHFDDDLAAKRISSRRLQSRNNTHSVLEFPSLVSVDK